MFCFMNVDKTWMHKILYLITVQNTFIPEMYFDNSIRNWFSPGYQVTNFRFQDLEKANQSQKVGLVNIESMLKYFLYFIDNLLYLDQLYKISGIMLKIIPWVHKNLQVKDPNCFFAYESSYQHVKNCNHQQLFQKVPNFQGLF